MSRQSWVSVKYKSRGVDTRERLLQGCRYLLSKDRRVPCELSMGIDVPDAKCGRLLSVLATWRGLPGEMN